MFLKSICTRAMAPRSLHTHFVIAHRCLCGLLANFFPASFTPTSSHSWQRKDCRRVCICKPPPLFFFLSVHFPFSIHTGGKWLRCFPCLHCHCLIYISLVLLKQQRHFASLRTDLFVAFHAHFLFHNYLKNSKTMYCTKCLCRHVSQLYAIIC